MRASPFQAAASSCKAAPKASVSFSPAVMVSTSTGPIAFSRLNRFLRLERCLAARLSKYTPQEALSGRYGEAPDSQVTILQWSGPARPDMASRVSDPSGSWQSCKRSQSWLLERWLQMAR